MGNRGIDMKIIRTIGIYFKIHGKYKCHQNALTAAQKV
jgi:hypothetical protein